MALLNIDRETQETRMEEPLVSPADGKGDAVISTTTQRKVQPKDELAAGTIEFSLYAPTITEAVLIGEFTDWHDRKMRRLADGTWRVRINLADGDHEYKFRVRTKSWFYRQNQWVTITDPKATKVDGRSGNGILLVREGKKTLDQYVWRHDDVPLAPNNKLVIYELHVGDFSGGEADPYVRGTFKDVTAKLDYLRELGINCIELMPIKEFPGDYGWGYTPLHLYAPESSYGSSEDLKQLIDEAHGRGIRVMVDGIYNHAHTDCPLAQIDHDYWFHHQPQDRAQSWGPQYNYELYDAEHDVMPARKFISGNIDFWVGTYHIDGIRYDAARQLGNFDAMRMMSDTARRAAGSKPFLNVAEYSPEEPVICGPPESGRPMDAVWQGEFFWVLAHRLMVEGKFDMEQIKNVIDCQRRGFTDCTQVVNFVSNHDQDRLMRRLGNDAKIFGDSAFARAKFLATLLLTAVGTPMVWMGGEFGEYKPKSIDPSKIDWTLLQNDANRGLHDHYKTMMHLRAENDALACNHIDFFHENVEGRVLGFVRWTDGGKRVAVIANFSDETRIGYTLEHFPCSGKWHDYLYNCDVQVEHETLVTDIGAWECRVLVWD